jgi:hypothetical protein
MPVTSASSVLGISGLTDQWGRRPRQRRQIERAPPVRRSDGPGNGPVVEFLWEGHIAVVQVSLSKLKGVPGRLREGERA